MELDRLLNAVGKQTFIKYYNYFKDLTYNSSDILDIITEDYTDKSKRSRLGHARMIFNEGLNKEALKIIINSNVPESVKIPDKRASIVRYVSVIFDCLIRLYPVCNSVLDNSVWFMPDSIFNILLVSETVL